jgi:hypothetical protein
MRGEKPGSGETPVAVGGGSGNLQKCGGFVSIAFQSVSLAFNPLEPSPVLLNGQLTSNCGEIKTLLAKRSDSC